MALRGISSLTPCVALRASLPDRGRRQISVFSGKTSGRRARRHVFRSVFVEDVTLTRKEVYQVQFLLPTASSTRRLRAAADWNSWRASSLKTHGGPPPLELSWRHARQRLAPCARAPRGRLRWHSTGHSEGAPPAPASSVERTPPPSRRLAYQLCRRGVGGRRALPAARGACATAAATHVSRAPGRHHGSQPHGWP